MSEILDLPQVRTFSMRVLLTVGLACGAAGWFGRQVITEGWPSASEVTVAAPAFGGGVPLSTTRRSGMPGGPVHRGVVMTPQMQQANRIFRTAFNSPLSVGNSAMTEFADRMAQEYIDRAVDQYRANPRAPYALLLVGQLEVFQTLAGGAPEPQVIEAAQRLRSMSMQ